VSEVFGLPPLFPLRVQWTCVEACQESGSLAFSSPAGVAGIATDCQMVFVIAPTADGGGSQLELTMSYEPSSPLASLALPVLSLDNAIALKLLLPRMASPAASPLGTQDPIAGPLVAVGRSVGILPEREADGWEGEPSAWADRDSMTQKLSTFSQRYLAGFKQWAAERVAGDFDETLVDAQIEAAVTSTAVVMYSFSSCPFCKRAKQLLDSKGAAYEVMELDELPSGAALRARLGTRTGRTSVPSIFIGGEYIGGMNDGPSAGLGLGPLDADGLLEPRLRAAGAIA